MILRFREFELDLAAPELRRSGAPVALQPKVLELLVHLARHRDRVVGKRELFERVWPGVAVSGASLTTAVNAAREALGDDGRAQRAIRTVPRRGYQFVAPIDSATAAPIATSAGFVGRDDALARLWSAFERARGGQAGVVLVAGEPGIGKTRIVEELGAAARAAGARVVTGWCHEGEGAPPFWPWTQVLRALGRELDLYASSPALRAALDEIAGLVPGLQRAGANATPDATPAFERPDGRFRLYDAVSTLLAALAARAPLVVALDDLHWADPSSLRLFSFVAREARAHLLLVGTYRPEDVDRAGALGEALAVLARLPGHERVVLEGLRRDEVARFVAAQSVIAPDPRLVDAIFARTDGNPFFIRELVRLLETEGAAGAGAIPAAVQDVVARRLARLSPQCRELLEIAAVVGREFPLDLVRRAAGRSGVDVARLLGEAERARAIGSPSEGSAELRFVHALIQESLYQDLGAARRSALHRAVADALERVQHERVDPPLGELARHWCLGATGDDVERVTSYSLRAARHALSRFAYEDAAGFCRRALRALDGLGVAAPDARCDLLTTLSDAEDASGNGEAARAALDQAAELARRLGSGERLARLASSFPAIETGVVDSRFVSLREEALAALGPGDSPQRAHLMGSLAVALYWSPADAARMHRLAQDALAMARRIGDPHLLASVLGTRHFTLWSPDALDERLALAEEELRVAEAAGDRVAGFEAHYYHLTDMLELGDPEAAEADIAALERLAREMRIPGWQPALARAMRATLEGRLDEAEHLAGAALEIALRARNPNGPVFYGIQLAELRRQQGRLAELEDTAADFVERYPRVAAWRGLLAFLHAEAGRKEAARRELEWLTANDLRDVARDAAWMLAVAFVAEVAALLGDRERASRARSALEPYAGRMIVVGQNAALYSAVARPLALAAQALGDRDAASAHFERALALERRFGARCLVARTSQQYAALLATSSVRADRERARQLADDALVAAESLEMRGVAALARATLEDTSGVIRLTRPRRDAS